ncbi:alpha/beta fold hydrolase [Streptomyces phaeochromogenes]|uniref:alpha/beta fold hydrolase n=1 Tax=Streptomyces phaeochromogenes TaxID=1923 RepID=UPI0033DBF514
MNAVTAPTKTVDVAGTAFAYREVGTGQGVPLVLLHHVTAVLDDWDPAVVDGLAAERHVIMVDLRGVGRSGGTTPDNFEAMSDDTIAFLDALGLDMVDLLGYSLGGIVAQVVAQQHSGRIRRIVLAGTTPAGAPGPAATGATLQAAIQKATEQGKHPKHFLFFEPTPAGQAAADAFLARLDQRTTDDRDTPISNAAIGAQLAALSAWETDASSAGLAAVKQPALVVNGDNDTMWPTEGTLQLAELLPDAKLAVYPNSGHGGIFQYSEMFVHQALDFLRD